MAVLRTLGVDIDSPEQADKLLAQRRNAETRLTGAGDRRVGRRGNYH